MNEKTGMTELVGASGATLPAQLLERARDMPGRTAYRHKRLGVWDAGTWSGYAADAAAFGLALEAQGVRPGERVAIAADNRPEWLIADLGVQGIGAVTVGIYPTSPAKEVEYLLSHSGAKVVVWLTQDETSFDDRVELGNLKGNVGDQQYAIPDSADLRRYDTVVLYCTPFTVRIAVAPLS